MQGIKISRRVCYLLLFCLTTLSIILRLPDNEWVNASRGSDAHAHHTWAVIVQDNGYIPWIYNLRSYFGMYPYTEPAGNTILITTISNVIGVQIEYAIIPYCFFLGFAGLFSSFMVGHTFFQNKLYSLLLALAFSLNYYFYIQTLWRLSERGIFISFMPLLIWSLLVINSKPSLRRPGILLFFTSIFLLFSVHRMNAFILPVVVFPAVLFWIAGFIGKKFDPSRTHLKFIRKHITIGTILLIVVAGSILVLTNMFTILGHPQEETWIDEEYDRIVVEVEGSTLYFGHFLNVGHTYVTMGSFFNLLLPFSLVGLYLNRTKARKDEKFILTLLAFQIIFSLDIEYFYPVFMVTCCILSVLGVKIIIENMTSKRSKVITIVLLVIFSSSLELYKKDLNTRVQLENNRHPEISGTEHRDTALWRLNNIDASDMTIIHGNIKWKLFQPGSFLTMDEKIILWTGESFYGTLEVVEYPLWMIFFHQRGIIEPWDSAGYFYGGSTTHPISGHDDQISRNLHEGIVLRKDVGHPSWDSLVEFYNLRYVVQSRENFLYWYTSGRGIPDIDRPEGPFKPFVKDVIEYNYKIYENEVFLYYYYDNN